MPSFAISICFGIPEQTQLLVYNMKLFQEGLTKEGSPSLSLRGSIQEGGRGQSYLKTCISPSFLPACGHMATSCHMAQKSLCHCHPFPATVDRSPKELSFLSWVSTSNIFTVMTTGTNCQRTETFDKGWRTWLFNIKTNSKITPTVNRLSAQTLPSLCHEMLHVHMACVFGVTISTSTHPFLNLLLETLTRVLMQTEFRTHAPFRHSSTSVHT